MQQNLQQKQQKTDWLLKRIRHPKERLQLLQNKLIESQQRNIRSIKNSLEKSQSRTDLLSARIQQHNPSQRIQQLKSHYSNINIRFQRASNQIMASKKQKLQHLVHTLDALSPLHTLKRGYAIVKDENNNIISATKKLKNGQQIKTELNQGHFFSTITDIHND